MRAHLTFAAESKITLPIHHNHILQAFIYNSFADETFAKFLHEQGYQWKKRNFKLFAFSRLHGDMNMNHDRKVITFKPPVTLVISSIKNRIIEDLITNIIKSDYLHLSRQEIFLEEVRMERYDFKPGDKSYLINFLSPVTAYRTEKTGGSKKTLYFKPWEEDFQVLLEDNLQKKYEIIYGEKINNKMNDGEILNKEKGREGNFTITPQFEKGEKDFTIIIFKGFVIKGWMGQFVISGDNELLQVGYDSGLGAKNSMGHGLFEVIEERDCDSRQ